MPAGLPDWPAMQNPASDRLILRDGTVATVRPAAADDAAPLRRFFHELSPESRYARFFVLGEPDAALLARCCDSSDPARNLTLVAFREGAAGLEPIAVASYASTGTTVAEVAFAVADPLHGRGLGTALLERLATIGSEYGLERFEATTLASNADMLRVFRDSGFDIHTTTAAGVVAIQLVLRPSEEGIAIMEERNRQATVASLRSLLQPRAVAVIGVSRDEGNLGRRVFDAILRDGFSGPVYAVNPNANDIAGRPAYRSVAELPRGIDLAVIATPCREVLHLVDECAAAGIRSLVVVSAGFAEVDAEGRAAQQAVLEKARAHGLRLIGPNCMGVLNARPGIRLNASFARHLPVAGPLAIASQSGGVGLALLEMAEARRLGISTFVSLGNKADVSGNDFLLWAETDPQTSVLMLYLESFGNPRRFAQLARRIGRTKPIVAVKAGRTSAGGRAASSHTAGLAANDAAVAALFAQSGVIRTDTIDEMFDVAQCLALQPLPAGNRVAIITNAGGPGILAADACEAAGLMVSKFGPETREALSRQLSAHASTSNPIDLVASAGPASFAHAVATAAVSPDVDSVLVIYTPIDPAQTDAILKAIGLAVAESRSNSPSRKPVVACTLSTALQPVPLDAGTEKVPVYVFPENAARALGRVVAYARWRNQPPAVFRTLEDIRPRRARALCRQIVATRGDTWLAPEELSRLLHDFGIRPLSFAVAKTEQEAAAVAGLVGYPVVLKVLSPWVLHKTDVGGVRLHLHDERAVRAAFRELAAGFPDAVATGSDAGIAVQHMLRGVELLVGVNHDPSFGPLIAFGMGGVETEVIRDVAFRIAPLSERDLDELMHGIRSFPLLDGYRGRPPADVAALRELLLRVSLLAQHVPELRELDLNPVIVLAAGHGCHIVDARARVAQDGPAPPAPRPQVTDRASDG